MQSLKTFWKQRLSSHAFQLVIPLHFFIQLLLHTVKKISTAVIFSAFDVRIEAVSIFGVYAEKRV